MTSISLRSRFTNHLSSIRNQKDTSIAKHFNQQHHDYQAHLKLGILDTQNVTTEELKIREGVWIYLLDTITDGINQRDESNTQLDFQALFLQTHFRHSKTCLPYIIPTLTAQRPDDLQRFKRARLFRLQRSSHK